MFKGLRTLFKMSKPTNDYNTWSKEQLIAKIAELEGVKQQNSTKKYIKKQKPFVFDKYNKRFIALKFSYLGWNYNGLAIQKDPTPLPTVEGVLVDALTKCKFIPDDDLSKVKFSRCGRTDRGVSALNQVVSLQVRSNLTAEEQKNPENDSKEIDYINVLNHLLPDDVKIHSICLRPPEGFDSRFSCTSRHYKYLFHKKGLDTALMGQGAKYFLGDHDFRNFCKLDGSKQITNFKRTILRADIAEVGNDFFVFDLQGTAFLWHQVRNMIGILFLVGQKLENPEIVKELLNPDIHPVRPVFDMGSDLPLVLYDCVFPEMEWQTANKGLKSERTSTTVYANWMEYNIKTQVAVMMQKLFPPEEDKLRINVGDGKGKIVNAYVPVNKRDRMESFEIVNERWKARKKSKKN